MQNIKSRYKRQKTMKAKTAMMKWKDERQRAIGLSLQLAK